MTNINAADLMREQFEAWAVTHRGKHNLPYFVAWKNEDGTYMDGCAVHAWIGWQAALAAPIPRDPVGWQPIETAPKDGTEIIGFYNEELRICSWEALDNPVAKHLGIAGTWHRRNIASGKSLMGGNFTPSHWQPLPAPPTLRERGADQ